MLFLIAPTLTKNNSFFCPNHLLPYFLSFKHGADCIFQKWTQKYSPSYVLLYNMTVPLAYQRWSLFLNLLLNFDRCWDWFDPKNTSKMTAQPPGFPWTILTAFALLWVEARDHIKVWLAFCETPKPPGDFLENEASCGKRKRPRPPRHQMCECRSHLGSRPCLVTCASETPAQSHPSHFPDPQNQERSKTVVLKH